MNRHGTFRMNLHFPASIRTNSSVMPAFKKSTNQNGQYLTLGGMTYNAHIQISVTAVSLGCEPESSSLTGMKLDTYKIDIIEFHPLDTVKKNVSLYRLRTEILK